MSKINTIRKRIATILAMDIFHVTAIVWLYVAADGFHLGHIGLALTYALCVPYTLKTRRMLTIQPTLDSTPEMDEDDFDFDPEDESLPKPRFRREMDREFGVGNEK